MNDDSTVTYRSNYFEVIIIIPTGIDLADEASTLIQPSNGFHAITDCSCSQDAVTYECRVCGLVTVWEGTALDSCSGSEIALTNEDFLPPIRTIFCNDRTVAARGISAENGCFTSQLNITFNADLQGRTVRCSVDNGTHASQVGRDTLALSTGIIEFLCNIYTLLKSFFYSYSFKKLTLMLIHN